jgi:hypothetical protein
MLDDFSDCTSAEKRRLHELRQALRTPFHLTKPPDGQWFTEAFLDEFTSRLLTQHVFLGNPMVQESFDTAFIESCRVANFDVEIAPAGQRFWDVNVNGKRLSLKTTKAKSLKQESLHISKLTEAAWIQDCRTATARRDHTLELFETYTEQVSSIFQFRYFSRQNRYELVEIPVGLLKQVANVSLASFRSEGPSIGIPVGQEPPDFTLKLDRSDAKITLSHIRKSVCIVHADWKIR